MIAEDTIAPKATLSHADLFETVKEIGPFIAQHVESEQLNRRLSEPVLNALREAGLYKLYLPASLGGIESDPVTTATLVEKVAQFNTAAAWSMMVANISAWFCCPFPEKGIETIYKGEQDVFLAGALHPPGRAIKVEGGYRITGRTPLASNVHEAKWVFVSALVMEGDQVKFNNGHPEIIGVFINPDDCTVIDTWYTIGLRATDSNDVVANDVFVPEHLSFHLVPGFKKSRYFEGLLYNFPAVGISAASLIAPIALSVASNAIDEFKALAAKKTSFGSATSLKERGTVQRKLGMAEALVYSSRAYLYRTLDDAWRKTINREEFSLEEKGKLLLAATHTNQSCFQAVDMLYSAAGTTAIYTSHKLARYFTDAQVIRQHGFANDSRYETVAQIDLGLLPDLPVVAF